MNLIDEIIQDMKTLYDKMERTGYTGGEYALMQIEFDKLAKEAMALRGLIYPTDNQHEPAPMEGDLWDARCPLCLMGRAKDQHVVYLTGQLLTSRDKGLDKGLKHTQGYSSQEICDYANDNDIMNWPLPKIHSEIFRLSNKLWNK